MSDILMLIFFQVFIILTLSILNQISFGNIASSLIENISLLVKDKLVVLKAWKGCHIDGLMVNYGISNTIVLEIP